MQLFKVMRPNEETPETLNITKISKQLSTCSQTSTSVLSGGKSITNWNYSEAGARSLFSSEIVNLCKRY